MSDRGSDDADSRDTADRGATDRTADRETADRETTDATEATDRTTADPAESHTTTERESAETRRAETGPNHESDPGEPDHGDDGDDGAGLSGGMAVLVAAVISLAATALVYWWIGGWAGNGVFFEELFRVAPTVAGGGVGADWVAGNTVPILDALIAIVHAADVLMGVMILGMVFLHWAAFRRLASRMRRPAETRAEGAVATDGGETAGATGGSPQSDGGDDR